MTHPGKDRTMEVLLVEDSAADALLTRSAFAEARMPTRIHVVTDGLHALNFLRREPPHEAAPRPDLILLDLNMPRKDGREVLADIKVDPELQSIPVIVLTTSEDPADVAQAYRLHANAYVPKPVDFECFADVVRRIDRFWFQVAALPAAVIPEGAGP